jgi:hypothetical protein
MGGKTPEQKAPCFDAPEDLWYTGPDSNPVVCSRPVALHLATDIYAVAMPETAGRAKPGDNTI